jgi:hypothetical protein
MRRMELMTNLLFAVPGPKMLWQFGELGYDFSINRCENGTINTNCRVSSKPVRWDFYQDAFRRRLYDVTSALLQLRKNNDAFETTNFQLGIGAGKGRTIRLIGANLNVHIVANTAITPENIAANFPATGVWYEYYTGQTLNVTATTQAIPLQPGEYRLYTDKFVALPPGVLLTATAEVSGNFTSFDAYPNPFDERILVQFDLSDRAKVQLEVFDLTGRLVYTTDLGDRTGGEQAEEIETANWQPGCYFLQLRDANGGKAVRKMIK